MNMINNYIYSEHKHFFFQMLQSVSSIIGFSAYRQNIDVSNDTNEMGNLTTYVDVFFINENSSSVDSFIVDKSEIYKLVTFNFYIICCI